MPNDQSIPAIPDSSPSPIPIQNTATPAADLSAIPTASALDFEIDAFKILDTAPSYNEGINQLTEYYKKNTFDDQQKANEILSKYGQDLRFKHKEAPLGVDDLLNILPIKPNEVIGATNKETIDNYENKNLEFLQSTNDPDYIATREQLIPQLKSLASEARRDTHADIPDDFIGSSLSYASDKFFRLAQGITHPLKSLGLDSLDRALYERTQRRLDKGNIANQTVNVIAGSLGAVGEIIGASAINPALGVAIMAGQAAAETANVYEQSLAATGEEGRALQAAGAAGIGQAVSMIPLGNIANKVVSSFEKGAGRASMTKAAIEATEAPINKVANDSINKVILDSLDKQKLSYGTVGIDALANGTAGVAGHVISNIANNIALDKEGDITEGGAAAFLGTALMSGVIHGASTLMENASIEQTKRKFQELVNSSKEPPPPPPPPAPGSNNGKSVDSKDAQVAEYFNKNDKGYYVPKPEPDITYEQKVKTQEEADKAYTEYVNEYTEKDPGKIYSDTGEETTIPAGQDTYTDEFPSNVFIEGRTPSDVKTSRYASVIARKVGANVELQRNIMDGARGSWQLRGDGSTKVKILRSLGANPIQFIKTLSHELGHHIDYIQNDGLKTYNEIVQQSLAPMLTRKELIDISKTWRGGWDGEPGSTAKGADNLDRFRAYRSSPPELYADLVSALIADHSWVKNNFPHVYQAYEKVISEHPVLQEIFDKINEYESDPSAATRDAIEDQHIARQKTGQIVAKERLEQIANKNFGKQLRNSIDLSYRFLFGRDSKIRSVANKLSGQARDEAYSLIHAYKSKDFNNIFNDTHIDIPLKSLLAEFVQSEIPIKYWAHSLWAEHIVGDETATMGRVKTAPGEYLAAAIYIKDYLLKQKGVNKDLVNNIFNFDNIKTPEQLNDAFAQLGIIGDTAKLLSLEDFLVKYDPADPDRSIKAKSDYTRALNGLARRRRSLPIENLQEHVRKLHTTESKIGAVPEPIKKALLDVTKDNAFAARRYLVNTKGANVYDAQKDLAYIRDLIGADKYNELQDFNKRFRKIMYAGWDTIKESQIFTPDMIARIEANMGNYVLSPVLTYFTGEDSIDSSVRSAIGSMSDTGNELTATPIKMKMINNRAFKQKAINAVVDLAIANGDLVEQIKGNLYKNVFADKDRYSSYDQDHSYLISYNRGVPVLNKLKGGKTYEDMFKSIRDVPVLSPFLHIADYVNNALLTKEFKTALSLPFAIGQKFMDRALEAVIANSFEPGGLPTHISPKLRAIDKDSIAEIDHWKKTGELTGKLKEAADLYAFALPLHLLNKDNKDSGLSYYDAVYELFGEKMPDEQSYANKLGNYTQGFLDNLGTKNYKPFRSIKNIAEFDELRTKLNGYRIATEILKQSPKEAAVFAREKFGIPDPMGGGIGTPLINRMFLFGSANFNGLKALGSLLKNTPKTMATQIAYRVVLPKLLVSGAVAGAAIGAYAGQEYGDLYKRAWNMVPSFLKVSSNPIILGMQDEQGNFHNFFDINPKKVTNQWKPWVFTPPQSRELTAISKIFYPLVTQLAEGEGQKALAGAVAGAKSVGQASVTPPIQYMYNILQTISGENPTDFFRMKGILSSDVAKGGTLGRKFADLGYYVASQQLPSIVPYNPWASSTAKGDLETLIKDIPIAGPAARRLVNVTNYGLIEADAAAQGLRDKLNSEIKLSTGDNTQEALHKYSQAVAVTSSKGKEWKKDMSPQEVHDIMALTSWHSKVFLPARDNLILAKQSGDTERYQAIINVVEQQTTAFLKSLK